MASDQVVQAPEAEASEATRARRGVLARGMFGNADFARLWLGESVSLIGTQVTQFAMPLVAVLSLNATVTEVGLLNALRFVPVLLLSLLAGVWLDRRRRRPVLIACSLGSAAAVGLVPLSSAAGFLSIGLLYGIVSVTGVLSMTFDVGALSYVPSLVGREHLTQANGRIQASTAFAGVAGPGLAGLLVGLITAPVTLSVDAVSYLFSAAGLISIRSREPAPEVAQGPVSVRRSIAEGLEVIWGTRLLRAMLTQGAALNLFFGGYTTLFVVYAIRVVHLSPLQLGIVLAAQAAGALAGATTAGRVRAAIGLGRTLTVNTVFISVALLALLIPRHASLAAVIIFVAAELIYGWNVAVYNVNSITLRQLVTPRQLLARMNASYRMVLWGVAPVGMSLGGLLGGAVGLRSALVISLALMATPLLWLISPVIRLARMPDGPPAPDPPSAPSAQNVPEGQS
jgi:predicted MFS family arabinose efflux permease